MLRTLVAGARDLGPVLSASAGLQAVALAIHLEDVDVVGEPVEQRAREALRAVPLSEDRNQHRQLWLAEIRRARLLTLQEQARDGPI